MTPHERAALVLAWVRRHPGTTTSEAARGIDVAHATAWRGLQESGCVPMGLKPWRWYPPEGAPGLPWWPTETSRGCGEPGCPEQATRTWRVYGWDTHRCEQHPPGAAQVDALARLLERRGAR